MRFADVDLNEDSDAEEDAEDDTHSTEDDEEEEEEEEEGDPSEFIDVLDVLDGRGEPESEDDRGHAERQGQENAVARRTEAGSEDEDEAEEDEEMDDSEDEDEEFDEEEGAHIVSASEDEDEGEEGGNALQELESFVTGLDAGQKRKAQIGRAHV